MQFGYAYKFGENKIYETCKKNDFPNQMRIID